MGSPETGPLPAPGAEEDSEPPEEEGSLLWGVELFGAELCGVPLLLLQEAKEAAVSIAVTNAIILFDFIMVLLCVKGSLQSIARDEERIETEHIVKKG